MRLLTAAQLEMAKGANNLNSYQQRSREIRPHDPTALTTTQQVRSQLHMEFSCDQPSRLGLYPKEMKTDVHAKTCPQMFTAALLTIAKRWTQPNGHQQRNGQTVIHLHTETFFSHKEEGSTDLCYDVDEPQKYMLRERGQTEKTTSCMSAFM